MATGEQLVEKLFVLKKEEEKALWGGTRKQYASLNRQRFRLSQQIVKTPDALKRLESMLDDPDPEIRLDAACLLTDAENAMGIAYLNSIADCDSRARVKLGLPPGPIPFDAPFAKCVCPETQPASPSIVAIGAHMDDCWLGMGGTALKAALSGHRVTMVQAVSTYGAWPVVSGRGDQIKPVVAGLAKDAGIGLITLGYDYMRLVHGPELLSKLARVLARLKPDILFCHWEDDSNQDHSALGAASRVAGLHGACFLPPERDAFKAPAEIYQYRADSQARNFAPDTFVDITDTLYDLTDMCAEFDALYSEYHGTHAEVMVVQDHLTKDRVVPLTAHTSQKFATSLLDGCRCGVRFAEGFRAYNPGPVGEQLLGRL